MTRRTYSERVGSLVLTVEPLIRAGHGEYCRTYVARVDVDVPDYSTTANVARCHYGRRDPRAAYEFALISGKRMLRNAVERFDIEQTYDWREHQ